MNLTQFLAVLKARWWVPLLVLVVTVGTTLAISLNLRQEFSATSTVVIDVKPDPLAAVAFNVLPANYLATQVDIIQSERVALRVVRNMKLADNADLRAQWQEDSPGGQGSFEAWIAESMRKNLDVKPSRESNVVAIGYRSPDPRFSAALANAFSRAYIDTSLELKVDPAKQYSSFFDARAKEARERLEAAQAKVSAFQRTHGIIASDERLDVENQRLNELSSQLVALQAVAAESALRQAQSQTAADRIQEVLSNPLIAGLKADQSRAEARLQELTQRLGDNHPQVTEAKASIASLRDKIESETRRVTGGVGVTANINRQREASIRSSLEAQRAKVLKMKAVRDDGVVLQREVESVQRAYEALLGRVTQTSLESQNTQSNIHVLTEATPPTKPSGPKVVQNTLMSFVVGLALALAAAIGLELLDRRVRVLDDLDAAVGLPVIGVLPTPDAKRLFGRRKLTLMQQRLLSLPAPQKG